MFMYSIKGLLTHLCEASFTRWKIGIIAVLSLSFVGKSSAQQMTYSQLEEAFLTINSQLPSTLGNGLEMTSVSINPKEVVFRYTVSDLGNGMSNISFDDPDTMSRMKAMVSAITVDEDIRMLFTNMARMNIGLKLQMRSANTGKTLNLDMSPKEVLDISTGTGITPFEWVRNWHQNLKSQLPLEMGTGIKITDAILTESMFLFVCQVNEAIFSFDNIVGNRESVREAICTMLFSGTDAIMIMQNTQLALAGLSLSYKYVGSDSGRTMMVDFSNQELRERMQLVPTEYEDSVATYEEVDSVAVDW